ncbi:MAG: NAD-dependent epimerase/dehydratase family protein [Acidobacteria bacterium]|nr:NAD-dependent epimerase/dehydratase family protein [Acidobacteriota bacterium]
MRHPLVEEDLAAIARGVGPGLERLRGKTILLTGGTGFVGTWILETIAWLNETQEFGSTVHVPTRSPDHLCRRRPHLGGRRDIRMVCGDVRTFRYPHDTCSFVIHAAASSLRRPSVHDSREIANTIVDGTRHVLDLAAREHVESFLFVSSGAVYGPQPPQIERVPEDYTGAPDLASASSAYGEAKRYAEMMCTLYREADGVPVRVARPFALTGPYQDLVGGFALTDFIRCCLRSEGIRIEGDGTPVRSFCYAADLTTALLKILLDAEPGSVFNVGSECEISISELARLIVNVTGSSVPITIEGAHVAGRRADRYVPDTSRLQQRLGFRPRYELTETLRRTIAWNRHHMGENA